MKFILKLRLGTEWVTDGEYDDEDEALTEGCQAVQYQEADEYFVVGIRDEA